MEEIRNVSNFLQLENSKAFNDFLEVFNFMKLK